MPTGASSVPPPGDKPIYSGDFREIPEDAIKKVDNPNYVTGQSWLWGLRASSAVTGFLVASLIAAEVGKSMLFGDLFNISDAKIAGDTAILVAASFGTLTLATGVMAYRSGIELKSILANSIVYSLAGVFASLSPQFIDAGKYSTTLAMWPLIAITVMIGAKHSLQKEGIDTIYGPSKKSVYIECEKVFNDDESKQLLSLLIKDEEKQKLTKKEKRFLEEVVNSYKARNIQKEEMLAIFAKKLGMETRNFPIYSVIRRQITIEEINTIIEDANTKNAKEKLEYIVNILPFIDDTDLSSDNINREELLKYVDSLFGALGAELDSLAATTLKLSDRVGLWTSTIKYEMRRKK